MEVSITYLCDCHTHTCFSFDGDKNTTPDSLSLAAIDNGVIDLCITDHFEANNFAESISAPYDDAAAFTAMNEAKEKYRGRINISRGIELGQAYQYPEEAKRILSSHSYDFVILSLHNLRGLEDFYYMDFSKVNEVEAKALFERCLDETLENIEAFGDFADTLGHITYMHRYAPALFERMGFEPFYSQLEDIFKRMISKNLALELNVSTFNKGLGFFMPDRQLLSFYKECGGRLITVGSDSHSAYGVGCGIRDGFELLKSLGFDSVCVVRDGKKQLQKID